MDHEVDQQLEDQYREIGLHRDTSNDRLLHLKAGGSSYPSRTCDDLQTLVAKSQKFFRTREDSKVLIKLLPLWDDVARAFVRKHGQYLEGGKEKKDTHVFKILMLEGHKAQQG